VASFASVKALLEARIRKQGLFTPPQVITAESHDGQVFVVDLSRTTSLPRLYGDPAVNFHGRRMGLAR